MLILQYKVSLLLIILVGRCFCFVYIYSCMCSCVVAVSRWVKIDMKAPAACCSVRVWLLWADCDDATDTSVCCILLDNTESIVEVIDDHQTAQQVSDDRLVEQFSTRCQTEPVGSPPAGYPHSRMYVVNWFACVLQCSTCTLVVRRRLPYVMRVQFSVDWSWIGPTKMVAMATSLTWAEKKLTSHG